MRSLLKTLSVLIVPMIVLKPAYSHEPGSYDMTFSNWLKHATELETETINVTASCRESKGGYMEIDLGYSGLHFHKKRNGGYDIAVNGWLNTLGIKSGTFNVIRHQKPSYPRTTLEYGYGRTDVAKELKSIFENISETGQFELIVEVNSMRITGPSLSVMVDSMGPPRNFHHTFIVSNPALIKECLVN